MNLQELIEFLSGPGAFIVVTWAISWGFEEFAWWHNLSSKLRALIILGASVLIGTGATYLSTMPPETLAPYEPFVVAVVAVIGAWLSAQGAHKIDKFLTK